MHTVNFDNNATTPVDPRVLDLMEGVNRAVHGNPSSLHGLGRAARRVVEEARERVATAAQCQPREVYFVSSATEANNLAICGRLQSRGSRVMVNPMEHKSVLEPLAKQASQLTSMDVKSTGVVDLSSAQDQLSAEVDLVVCQAANNETGCLQPVEALSAACAEQGVPLFVDAVQAPGRMDVSSLLSCATVATLSSHKIFGPKGAGAVLLRAETELQPMILGGAQERGRRAGTENVAAIAGFGLAMEIAVTEAPGRQAALAALGAELQGLLMERFPEAYINGEGARRLPGVINICIPGISAESLMMNLDMAGFAVSVGSACSSGSTEPSHVLEAMGHTLEDNHASVRFSLSHLNTPTELQRLDAALADIAPRLFL